MSLKQSLNDALLEENAALIADNKQLKQQRSQLRLALAKLVLATRYKDGLSDELAAARRALEETEG